MSRVIFGKYLVVSQLTTKAGEIGTNLTIVILKPVKQLTIVPATRVARDMSKVSWLKDSGIYSGSGNVDLVLVSINS